MLYYLKHASQTMQQIDLSEVDLEVSLQAPIQQRFPQLPLWDYYVLVTLATMTRRYGPQSAVSYSVLHRYCVQWWLLQERIFHTQLLMYLLTFGHTQLTKSFWEHVLLFVAGPRLAEIYAALDGAINHLITAKLIHYEAVPFQDDTVHFYSLPL